MGVNKEKIIDIATILKLFPVPGPDGKSELDNSDFFDVIATLLAKDTLEPEIELKGQDVSGKNIMTIPMGGDRFIDLAIISDIVDRGNGNPV